MIDQIRDEMEVQELDFLSEGDWITLPSGEYRIVKIITAGEEFVVEHAIAADGEPFLNPIQYWIQMD